MCRSLGVPTDRRRQPPRRAQVNSSPNATASIRPGPFASPEGIFVIDVPEEPRWITPQAATGGRPQERPRRAEGSPRPVSRKGLAARRPLREVTWREGTQGKLSPPFAFSDLPAGTPRRRAVRLGKGRRPVEPGYQRMKQGLGLDHFEGRSWRGFHRHACLGMLA